MVQLVGVDDGPDRLHPAVGDVQDEHVDHPAFAVVADPAGLAVHPGWLDVDAQLGGAPVQAEHEPGHRDRGEVLVAGRVVGVPHRGARLGQEVLDDHLLHVPVATVRRPDREQ